MDALKSAGRAIIRSPSLAKQSWISGKHKSEFHGRPSHAFERQSGCLCLFVTCVLKQEFTRKSLNGSSFSSQFHLSNVTV